MAAAVDSSAGYAVLKATKAKREPPKEKFVNAILRSTFANDNSFENVCQVLALRVLHKDPTVSLKSLLVIHLILSRGPINKSLSYLASKGRPVELQPLIDRVDFPANICRYAKYINARLSTFASLHFDIIKSKSDKAMDRAGSRRMAHLSVEDGLLVELEALDKLLDTLADCMLGFDDVHEDALTDLGQRYLFHDLFKLVEAVTEGVLNGLQRFFTLNQTESIRILELYERHRKQLADLQRFFDIAKAKGQAVEGNDLKLPSETLMASLRDYVYGNSPPIKLMPAPPPRRRSTSSNDTQAKAPSNQARVDVEGMSLEIYVA